MAKILLFGDIHIHPHKDSLRRLQHCLDTLKWVFETAQYHNISDVVFLGDLYQDREKIQVLPYQRTYEIIKHYVGSSDSSLRLHMLVGNHDMWFANKCDVSSIIPLGSVPNVRIVNRCETINIGGIDIDFLPFTLNPLDSLKKFPGSSSVLFGHIALHGSQLNTFYNTRADVSVEYEGDMVKVDAGKFAPWKRVFLGHYHAAQQIGHIEYVGSPLEMNFAEAFQKKHIVVFDTADLSAQYVTNNFSPRHLILKESELDQHNLNNTFIQLEPDDMSAIDLVDIKKELMETHDILSFDFSVRKIKDDEEAKMKMDEMQSIFVQDRNEMLEQYLRAKGVPKGLNFDKLLALGRHVCEESQVE